MTEQLGNGQDFSADAFRNLTGLYYFGPAHPVFTDLANTSSVDILEFPETGARKSSLQTFITGRRFFIRRTCSRTWPGDSLCPTRTRQVASRLFVASTPTRLDSTKTNICEICWSVGVAA